jgi:hypothetical protein
MCVSFHVDGGGGTGKSYMVKILSSHLQQVHPNRKSPILRAAPTGVASNQINGQTLHSLLRLPIDGVYKPLSESPGIAIDLNRVFDKVKYLVIDEKSMLGLKTLNLIDRRLREINPAKNDVFFGGLSVILIGDFFQLPPVLNKPIYIDLNGTFTAAEISGWNAYQAFTHSVFLETIQRQAGDDQRGFREALKELRQAKVSPGAWDLLSSRCAVNLSPQEKAAFATAARIYTTREKVLTYNHEHLVGLNSPALYISASNSDKAVENLKSEDAGNLSNSFPIQGGDR